MIFDSIDLESQREQPNTCSGSGLAHRISFTTTQYNVPDITGKLEMHHKTVTLWKHFLPHKKPKQ